MRGPKMPMVADEDAFWFDDACWKCGGEGYVSDCFEEWACLHPEEGCDLCTERCDVCNPRKAQP